MAKQILENGETGLVIRNKINENFTELYDEVGALSPVATSGSYNDLSDKPTIPDQLSDLSQDATHRTVTDTEKSTWNAKQNALGFVPASQTALSTETSERQAADAAINSYLGNDLALQIDDIYTSLSQVTNQSNTLFNRTINEFVLGNGNIVIPSPSEYKKIGEYYNVTDYQQSNTTITLVVNQLRAMPFIVGKTIKTDEMKINVTTAVAASQCRIGIYNDLGIYPNQAVAQVSFDTSATGEKTGSLGTTTLLPGLYWLAVNANGAAVVTGLSVSSVPNVLGTTPSTFIQRTGIASNLTYGILPFTFPAGSVNYITSNTSGLINCLLRHTTF